ncbi:type I secretion C-terminal target domain-containing protein [Phenylobacterium sp.]|uniref:type I secretion C-terminal target domain-containing protein n=1 Tax=Phenylobacterium sp. TaxID=1871053 RepID=UPI002DE72A56|nr:type I secretion C-terminal target domain-containing protein [Phenylobacterium sp.]
MGWAADHVHFYDSNSDHWNISPDPKGAISSLSDANQRQQILDAIDLLHTKSPELLDFATANGQMINIAYAAGPLVAFTQPFNTYTLYIGLRLPDITDLRYINTTGDLVAANLSLVIEHELAHYIGRGDDPSDLTATDLKGPAVEAQNQAALDLGLPDLQQASYNASTFVGTTRYDQLPSHSLTNGNPIANAIFGDVPEQSTNDLIDLSHRGDTPGDLVLGFTGDDTLIGTAGNDYLYGGSGNDSLSGGPGNDHLDGGPGNDTLDGGPGDDTIQGVEPNDVIQGHDGNDSITMATASSGGAGGNIAGGSGDDQITGSLGDDSIEGDDGNDVLRGGGGSDTISGGNGDDLIVIDGNSAQDFSTGDQVSDGAGNDTLVSDGTGYETFSGGPGDDVYQAGVPYGLGAAIIHFGVGDGHDRIADTIRHLSHATDSTWETDDFLGVLVFDGLKHDDVEIKYSFQIVNNAFPVSDFFWGDGDITFVIKSTGETFDLGFRDNFFNDNASDGTPWGFDDENTFQFADGFFHLDDIARDGGLIATQDGGGFYIGNSNGSASAVDGQNTNDVVVGESGDDTLTGHGGDDTLSGGAGDDTYVYISGDGNDIVREGSGGGNDTLKLEQVAVARVTYERDGQDSLILHIAPSTAGGTDGGSVKLLQGLDQANSAGVEQIQFDDGTIRSVTDIRESFLTGTAGNDQIVGFTANDTITGGLGDDTLEGRWGDDTYVWMRGDGNDVIVDQGGRDDSDTLRLTNEVSSGVSLARSGADLIVTISATGEHIQVTGQFDSSDSDGIEVLRFSDGSSLDRAQIASATGQGGGSSGQVINVSYPDETGVGGSGDDTVNADQAADTLTGGGGADHFVFSAEPWAIAHITDFQVGTDKLDLSGMFSAAGYTGSDPVADHYIVLGSDGNGGTEVFFDPDGPGSAHQWPDNIIDLEGVSPTGLTWAQLSGQAGSGGSSAAIALSTTSVTHPEGNSGLTAFTYTVTRTGDTSGASTVDWSVAGSGAHPASADDFDGGALPSGSLTFAAGETSKTITVNVSGDTTAESDEGFTLTLANPTGATLGTSTAAGTITDDDTAGGSGQVINVSYPDETGVGGSGDDTINADQAADTLTGGGGADHFVFAHEPWAPAHITDFQLGADKLDLSGMLRDAGYTGSDPIADQYVVLMSDGNGGTKILFDPDGTASGHQWPDNIIDIEGVDLTTADPAGWLIH